MRVYIDPGHGGDDPGAVHGELVEKDIALRISERLEENLRDLGHETLMSRRDDVTISLHGRASMANEWKADLFLSVHLNADADPDEPGMPEAKGSEFWIFPGSVNGAGLAATIDHAIAIDFPDHPARGVKEANFAVLRLTKMPAVLLELAFIDTNASEILKDPKVQELLAASIAAGVHRYVKGQPGAVV